VKIHEKYIKRCLELAKNGLGITRPNPMVGCVIVCNNVIIGEGYTSPFGGHHAEVNAITSVMDKGLLEKSTLYVSLEPCNHFGKTPPCSDLIVKSKISKVIVGCVDPFAEVAGKGIEKLKKHGCEVIVGVLEEECIDINKRFFTYHLKKRPYIILKWAETIDGFVSPDFSKDSVIPQNGLKIDNKKLKQVQIDASQLQPVWITHEYSRQLVHKWRAEEQAILVGTSTVMSDNPRLDVRYWKGDDPLRLVLDSKLRIPENFHILDGHVKTIIFSSKEKEGSKDLIYKKLDFSKNIVEQINHKLYEYEIQSLIVEGGTQTIQTFIDLNLWDEARIFIGNKSFLRGVKAPIIKGEETSKMQIGLDTFKIIKNI